jgi:GT2 family glycosyltransferase
MSKFLILIVLYECKVKESLSYISLLKSSKYLSNSKLILWDNSPSIQSVDTDDTSFFQDVEYIHTPENMSLSKIYNRVIQENEENDYLIILDQDSSFSSDYLEKLNCAIIKHPSINLFLPLIKSEKTIVSPGDYKIFKGSYWKKEQYGLIDAKNILAINSGMAINFNYLKNSYKGYDERLRFYGTDTFFMFEYSKDNNFLFVIDYVFKHKSALLDRDENIDKQIIRLNDLFFAWRIIHEYKKFNLILINIYILIRIFKLVIKYRNIKYFELLKIYIHT